jgi:hypothetical protein
MDLSLDERRIERMRQAQREYYEASQPIIKIMASVVGRPRLILKDGVVISHETLYTPEQEQIRRECQRILAQLQDSIRKGNNLL